MKNFRIITLLLIGFVIVACNETEPPLEERLADTEWLVTAATMNGQTILSLPGLGDQIITFDGREKSSDMTLVFQPEGRYHSSGTLVLEMGLIQDGTIIDTQEIDMSEIDENLEKEAGIWAIVNNTIILDEDSTTALTSMGENEMTMTLDIALSETPLDVEVSHSVDMKMTLTFTKQ